MAKKKSTASKVETPVVTNKTVEQLIVEHHKIDDYIKAQNKKYADFLKPHKDRLEEIGNQLLAMSNTEKWQNVKTDAGTAYRSTLLNVSVSPDGEVYKNADGHEVAGREALLDFALDNWNEIGNDLLLVSPQKDAVKKYMEEHEGRPPPGLKIGWYTRINVTRS